MVKRDIFRLGLSILLVMLFSVALLVGACGPKEATQPPTPTTPTPTPIGNQPPTITNLTAEQTQVHPSGKTEIQCIASDADGDNIDFLWSATGGSFSGAGPFVIWQAPEQYGTYEVKVTVNDGKGGSTQMGLNLTVSANQSPVINSFDANPSTILYGGSTTLTCVATDPDGDVVKYSWTASEGNITGVGNKVTWIAPGKGGEYTVTVVVSDGKGGESRSDTKIVVTTTTNTVTITPIAQETGTVSSEGDKDNSRTLAGDDEKNIGYCAYWSFDIWSLRGANIDNAKLKFDTRVVVGDPFSSISGLKGLRFWEVKYSDKLPGFQYSGTQFIRGGALFTTQPVEIDVTPEIGRLANAAATRFQSEALFMSETNGNNVAEFIEWSSVVLEVTYSGK